jgi:amino acid transporter
VGVGSSSSGGTSRWHPAGPSAPTPSGARPGRSVIDWILGPPLEDSQAGEQQVGLASGISVLGLDALSSAAYGPEAVLTLLIPLGMGGLRYVGPIIALVGAILLVLFLSYRQTIAAYPQGGGAYSVASENLGRRPGLLGAAALMIDYVLNVAVGISAGVAALVSAVPALLPHTLGLCLGVLVLLTLVNLRGVRESGLAFLVPTYAFICTLAIVIVVGVGKALTSGGHPTATAPPPPLPGAMAAVGPWILVRAFAAGCAALTGVEAVSNAVPIFREPSVPRARRTLTAIVAVLVFLLAGIAYLTHAYRIGATPPGRAGYQSVLSILTGAVFGRGPFYFVTIAAIMAVLALSANTSFAAFPRLCRVLASDQFLPGVFAVRGRRLVFSHGIVLLAVLAAILLIGFGGITDRLIPLFTSGALLAFTVTQAGMVKHWRKRGGPGAGWGLAVNASGAIATGAALAILWLAKFGAGAWVTVLVVPLLVLFFGRVNRHYREITRAITTIAPLELPEPRSPIVVLAAGGWNKAMQQGLKFALRLSREVYVVQVRTEIDSIEDLADNWELLIASPARAAGIPEPRLVVLGSRYRQFLEPFVGFINQLEAEHPDRDIAVVIPELVVNRWYEAILHNNRGTFLRTLLRRRCSARVVVIQTSYRYADEPASRPG